VFFYLSKILAFLFSPLVWVFLLLLYSFITRIETRAKRLRIAALVVLYVFSNSFLVDECFRAYEPVTPDIDSSDARYEGAIILGGIGDIDLRQKKIIFGVSADRLFQTLPLYYQKKIRYIVFSGGSGSIEFPEKREGIYVRKYLHSIGIPDTSLIVESTSKNTYENAVFTRRILDSLQLKGNYLLVTSAFHMPRSMAIFKKAGFKNITPFITNKSSGIRRYTFDHLFIPDPGALISIEVLIHEWVGYLIYKIKGYA
jgi:uncharacterized SAM-binding protein YcdF (DUF218 family)